MLLVWVWVLFGDGGGWLWRGLRRGLGDARFAGYTQRSSTLFAACSAIDLCRGSPYLEVSGGGVPASLELPVPQPEDTAVGIAGIVCDRRRAPVISKVELDHPHLVLMRMHPRSFLVPNQHGILSASPVSTRT